MTINRIDQGFSLDRDATAQFWFLRVLRAIKRVNEKENEGRLSRRAGIVVPGVLYIVTLIPLCGALLAAYEISVNAEQEQ